MIEMRCKCQYILTIFETSFTKIISDQFLFLFLIIPHREKLSGRPLIHRIDVKTGRGPVAK